MEKSEFRAVIKHLYLKGLTPKEIKAELDEVHGTSAPVFATVYNWVNEFKRGRTSTKDEHRSGRPVEVTTPEMIDKIHDMVLSDRRIKVREIVEATGISQGTVFSILHEKLGVKKISARWVPRLLSVENKRNRVVDSEAILALFRRNPDEFLRRYITVDETWIHYYTPETKEQSKQWVFEGERAPKKAKTVKSAGKVMATVFWDTRGIIYTDYLEKGKTITGEYYASLLHRLSEEIKEKRPHLKKKKILFHQDNARVHTCAVSMAKITELKFELLPHPPYSPDLAPSDFFLFPNLKKWLGGQRFTSNEMVIAQTNAYFEDLPKSYFLDGLKKLEKRLEKCIELKGDYVEK
ncbi:histone-lysine N-methyltransferase SETMAR-like [Centruroides sculpturatus]|uniref:histone-lysine N-methyltransferase SETMAR-like n=1 Tax=Centruroides sculpturatus TaxID=218467 RepID=UPI000C6CAA6F|nr:histone-lysine N-methyltransferase SETMAR-like [Centruroides sculpturatus]XP_023228713.1 histone-lysine N-methyltransferase SETMAR-like [Centruroides sculpturatus]XP_023230616.1 histone-lysine N-methyltransferase SETMAR-like [Centruroides sculpturatus]